jgi:hypothetical protein
VSAPAAPGAIRATLGPTCRTTGGRAPAPRPCVGSTVEAPRRRARVSVGWPPHGPAQRHQARQRVGGLGSELPAALVSGSDRDAASPLPAPPLISSSRGPGTGDRASESGRRSPNPPCGSIRRPSESQASATRWHSAMDSDLPWTGPEGGHACLLPS